MLLQEVERACTGVAPDFVVESMAGTGIDFDFVGNVLLLEQIAKLIGLCNVDGGIGFAVEDEHGTEAAHEELHLARKTAEEFHDGFYTAVDRGVGEREIGSERKAEERDSFAVDGALAFDEADGIPQGFHPQRKISKDDLLVGELRAGAVEVMEHVDGETFLGEEGGIFVHSFDIAARAVKSDYSGRRCG